MSETIFEVDKDNLEVRITKLFKASPERLWKAYTDPEEIIKWWSDTTVDKHELKVGGNWRFVSQDSDGNEHAFRGVFQEIDEPNKIVRTFIYEPYPDSVMTETVVFTPEADGTTKTVTTSKYQNINQLEGMVNSGMERGASAGLERLAKVVES